MGRSDQITELDLQALVDEELDNGRKQFITEQLHTNPSLLAKYEELLAQRDMLRSWWGKTFKNI